MLKSILLENYKCYKSSKLSFKDITIIVGSNNAGKSTLIEALRLIAFAVGKCKSAVYKEMPPEFNLPKAQKGFRINTDNIDVDLKCVVHQLEGAYAKLDATFEGNDHIIVYANQDGAYACLIDANRNYITTKGKASKTQISSVMIMPQIGLIRDEEKLLSPETIENGLGTRLSSRHFLNELVYYRDKFYEKFKNLAQSTWDGLRIQYLIPAFGEDPISLLVYDGSFSAEIGTMGSGLQMWLQIMWFLSRCEDTDTIILDEPDVYMHPDMQRRIFDLVTSSYSQVIIATHSTEIISGADPRSLVTIDKNSRSFTYANDIQGAQSIIENIGGIHNLSLLRLGSAKKCVFVEGHDMQLLSKICKQVFPDEKLSISEIPCIELGGKGRFNEALGTARLFYQETSGQIKAICLLDRDYSTPEEMKALREKAQQNHLILHLWEKKEIENYLVTPAVLSAVKKLESISPTEFLTEIETAIEKFRDVVFDALSQSFYNKKKELGVPAANDAARQYLNEQWTSLENRMALINGKDLIKTIKEVAIRRFSIRLRNEDFINAMTMSNISPELLSVLRLLID